MSKCKTCGKAVKRRRECSKCRHRRKKKEQPMRYLFNMHRSNAARRKPNHFREGIPWLLTFEQFCKLWEDSGKLPEKLRSLQNPDSPKCNWEIDLIDPYKGYELGNVRIVSKVVNINYWWNPRLHQMEFGFAKLVDPDINGDWKQAVPF